MKKIILIPIIILISSSIYGQKNFNNAIKVNISALIFKNISLQYERKVNKRFSVALNYRILPFGAIPFSTILNRLIDKTTVDFDKLNIGSSALTPEIRLYVSKKGSLHGFYIGPFASFANYKTDFPINFAERTGLFKGSMQSITGGIQFGTQMRLSRRLNIDWWIVGPNIGNGRGNLSLSTPLSANDQINLKDKLEQLKNDIPFSIIKSYIVNSSGAIIDLYGPFGGLRGLGFNLSLYF